MTAGRTRGKVEFFDRLIHSQNGSGNGRVCASELAFGLLTLTLGSGAVRLGIRGVACVWRTRGWAGKDFQGIAATASQLSLCSAVMGQCLANAAPAIGVLVVSALGLGLLCSGFARGAYVS